MNLLDLAHFALTAYIGYRLGFYQLPSLKKK